MLLLEPSYHVMVQNATPEVGEALMTAAAPAIAAAECACTQ
jgi:hypothetical protein